MKTGVFRLIRELRRRHVVRVAIVYIVSSWVVVEAAATLQEILRLPDWTPKLVLVLALLGLPLAIVLSWAFDLTPDGVRRTSPTSADSWGEIQDLFAQALELPSSERISFLKTITAGKPGVRRELESLLHAHERSSPLDASAAEWLAPIAHEAGQIVPGAMIAQYKLLDMVGAGGMGIVYRARDLRLERVVALKFLPGQAVSPASKLRFMHEAQAAAALDHPNICTVLEVGETESGQLFIVMPYYEGETLKEKIAHGPLPPEQAISFVLQAAKGLSKAHERDIVHRDIKTANLLVTSDGLLKIVDFGIAKLRDVSVTGPSSVSGTLAYMSPEQALGTAVDARTDLWSLGVVFFEMLTGERPFRGGTDPLVLESILNEEPPPLATFRNDVSPLAERVMRRMLARPLEARYANAGEVVRDLEQLTQPAQQASPTPDPSGEDDGDVMLEGERRPATVVVCTIGAYAEMIEKIGNDAVDQLLGRVQHAAAEICDRLGGTLNVRQGEEIMLLFGVRASHEDHCVRALRTALELHARVNAIAADCERPELQLNTGIDTGAIVAYPADTGEHQYRVHGTAVQTAARVATLAAPDEIWVTQECRRMAGMFFDTEPRTSVVLRGRDKNISLYRLLRHTGLRTRFEAAQRIGLTPHVGRDREITILKEAMESSEKGTGQLVTIVGEAGLGKSRLLHEFRRHIADANVRLLQGNCQSYGGSIAYLPFVDLLRSTIGTDARKAATQIRAVGSELELFIPLYLHLISASDDSTASAPLQGEQLKLALQEALAALITLYARQQPVVLLLEDWHWVDEASDAVLRQLAELAPEYPLLIVVSTRPGGSRSLANAAPYTTISLEPLFLASARDMLRSLLQVDDFPEQLAEVMHERSGGNPFFLEEICHSLVEEGTVRVEKGIAVLSGSIYTLDLPDTVQAVLRTRIDRLDRDTREVLRIASVIGREFSRSILEDALPEVGRLPNALQILKAAGLIQQVRVVPDSLFRFKHVLTQEVTYNSLLEHQRKELHGRVARTITSAQQIRIEDYYDRLAYHFRLAEDWQNSIEYGLKAATRAEMLSDYAEALQLIEHCRSSLQHLPTDEAAGAQRLVILLREERLCETLGLRARQQGIIDELLSILDPASNAPALAEVYVRQGDLYTLLRRFDEASDALAKSLQLRRRLQDRSGERNTLRSIGLLRWHAGENAEALRCIEDALVLDRSTNDRQALVTDLINKGAVLRGMGNHSAARSALEEALAITEDVTQNGGGVSGAVKLCYVLHHLANVHRDSGDFEKGLECLHRALEALEGRPLPTLQAYHYTSIAHIHLQNGQLEESISNYRAAVEASRRVRYAPGLSQSLRFYADVLAGLNRYEEALPNLIEAAELFTQLEDKSAAADMWAGAGRSYAALGRPSDAHEAWLQGRAFYEQAGNEAGVLGALEAAARTARECGSEGAEVLQYYREAAALAQRLGDLAAEGRVRNSLAIMEWQRANYEEALNQYRAAFNVFTALGDERSAGLMLNSIALTLKQSGRTEEGIGELEHAIARHRSCGHALLEAHALAVLGDIHDERGAGDQALQHYGESLRLRQQLDDRAGEGWMLQRIARVRLKQGAAAGARELAERAVRIAQECRDEELRLACEELVALNR